MTLSAHEISVLILYHDLTPNEREAFDRWTETHAPGDLVVALNLGNGVQRLLDVATAEHVDQSALLRGETLLSE